MVYLNEEQKADPDLDPLVCALDAFEKAQHHYADFGACDTEPDGVWHVVLRAAVLGEDYPTPRRERNPWQLFSTMTGFKRAEARLDREARFAHLAIRRWREEAPANQWRKMHAFLKEYAWRVDWCSCDCDGSCRG